MLDIATFKCVVENAPLISIDLIVKKNNKFLLGKRVNNPAKGYYFVPGGRVFKNEKIENAFKRITQNELNREFDIKEAKFLGVYEHFYDNSFFDENISTHYVVLAYEVELKNNLDLIYEQHSNFKWLSKEEILKRENIHKYSKAYFAF